MQLTGLTLISRDSCSALQCGSYASELLKLLYIITRSVTIVFLLQCTKFESTQTSESFTLLQVVLHRRKIVQLSATSLNSQNIQI